MLPIMTVRMESRIQGVTVGDKVDVECHGAVRRCLCVVNLMDEPKWEQILEMVPTVRSYVNIFALMRAIN